MLNELPNASGVYRIRCLATGRDYVGSSADIRRRVQRHVRHLNAGTHHNTSECSAASVMVDWSGLQQDWNIHGPAAFDFATLELTADLVGREKHWICALGSSAHLGGYNLAEVTERTPGQLDWALSEPSREKIKRHPNVKAALRKSYETQKATGWASGRANLAKLSTEELSAAGRKGNRAGKSDGARKLSRLAAQAMGWNYREDDAEKARHYGHTSVENYRAERDARNAFKAAQKRKEPPDVVAALRADWQRFNALKVKARG